METSDQRNQSSTLTLASVVGGAKEIKTTLQRSHSVLLKRYRGAVSTRRDYKTREVGRSTKQPISRISNVAAQEMARKNAESSSGAERYKDVPSQEVLASHDAMQAALQFGPACNHLHATWPHLCLRFLLGLETLEGAVGRP